MDATIYRNVPLDVHYGIPVFSVRNEYIENYERISADHLKAYNKDSSNPFMAEHIWCAIENSTIEIISQYLKTNDTILDAGVGMGRLLSHFPQARRYGFDISSGYLAMASKQGIEVCLSLIEDMPYKENYFDMVVCTDVLEHVLDLNAAVTNILRVLKDDGTFVLRVPYREELKCYLESTCPYEFVHLRNFDEHSLMLLFTRIFKCRVIKMTTAATFGPVLSNFRGAGLLSRMIRGVTVLFPEALASWIRTLMLKPLVINVVIRKY